jgi:hypothetical protein
MISGRQIGRRKSEEWARPRKFKILNTKEFFVLS